MCWNDRRWCREKTTEEHEQMRPIATTFELGLRQKKRAFEISDDWTRRRLCVPHRHLAIEKVVYDARWRRTRQRKQKTRKIIFPFSISIANKMLRQRLSLTSWTSIRHCCCASGILLCLRRSSLVNFGFYWPLLTNFNANFQCEFRLVQEFALFYF